MRISKQESSFGINYFLVKFEKTGFYLLIKLMMYGWNSNKSI